MLVIVIIGISILISKPYSQNIPKNLSSRVSEKPRSGPKPGNCLILEQKYCSQAKLIEVKKEKQTYKNIGFHLPAGAPLFSPIDGNLGKAKVNEPSPLHGFLAIVNNSNDPRLLSFSIYGDIKFDNMLSLNVKKGNVIGHTQNTGVKGFGDYNIVLQVTRLNPGKNGFITDEELLRKMFLLQ